MSGVGDEGAPIEAGQPTAMLDDAEAARLAEATARTEDFSDLSPEIAEELGRQATRRAAIITVSGGVRSDAATMADVRVGDVLQGDGEATLSDVDAPATAVDQDVRPTAVEHHPARTNDVDPVAARAALDAKIRAHLDQDSGERADPLIGTTVGGRFEIVSHIGAGGMGAVYRARQRGIDRDVAVKVLLQELTSNETLTRRFTIEALAVSRLKHPHTIQIFDFGKTDLGNLYIAMELLEGDTLYGVHARERRLPVRRALRIISQVAGSLAEAHGKDIVHRDLKPENIFLTRVGDDHDFVKVLDFGVAKLRDGSGDGKGTLTKAGSIFGTPRYMSPEQASARPVDARSDLYALGVILYELIVGHPPFQSDTPLTLLLAHVNDTPQAPSAAMPEMAIPLEVEDLILTLLAKSPDDRLQSATELEKRCSELAVTLPEAFEQAVAIDEAEALGVALSAPATVHVPAQGLPDDTVVQVAPETEETEAPKRRGGLFIGVALALVGVVAGALLLSSGTKEAPPAPPAPEAKETTPAPVKVQVTTVPPGASVLDTAATGEQLLGTTPLTLTRAPGTRLKVRLERDGHVSQTTELVFDQARAVTLALQPTPKAVPPPKPPPPPSDAAPQVAKPTPPESKKPARHVKRRHKGGKTGKAAKASKTAGSTGGAAKKAAVKPPPKKKDPGLVDDLM